MPDPSYDTSAPVLVTGATGFVVGWLVKRLLEEGFTVHAAVRDPGNGGKSFTRPMIAKNMGHSWRGDNSKSRERLGLEYRPVETAVTDMFQQMIDSGAVVRK